MAIVKNDAELFEATPRIEIRENWLPNAEPY